MAGALHRTVWRWHFYAGLFCVPLVLWLAVTGTLYLFKPQVEAWQEWPMDRRSSAGQAAPASAQVRAALDAEPGAAFRAYQLPPSGGGAARVLLQAADGTALRLWIEPRNRLVLDRQVEAERLMPTIARLHGTLGIGDPGSWLVELAASWAIVMIATGLYLGWPRDGRRFAGVLWPRLDRRGRPLWRDLHAVVGVWASGLALFLIISGLPWTSLWGSNLRALRAHLAQASIQQDWTTKAASLASGHAGHDAQPAAAEVDLAVLDRLLPNAMAANLAPPVLIVPPSAASPYWQAKSDAQNRPQRVTLSFDAASGTVLRREDFAGKPLFDRIVGTGIAAHEGQLFGLANQLLGLFTTLSLIALCSSAVILWLKRRPPTGLGAPPVADPPARLPAALLAACLVLTVLLPMFGLSWLAVLIIERSVLRRLPAARTFLGLAPA